MSIVKLNNRAVKDATAVGSITGLGNLVFISRSTASSSTSVSITSGISSTYKEYIFVFNNLHLSNDNAQPQINFSIDGGSNYNVTKTSTNFSSAHNEADSSTLLGYNGSWDLAQATTPQPLTAGTGYEDDESASGFLHLYNPSDTTFVKHFISRSSTYNHSNYVNDWYVGGYCNVTAAIDAVQFSMSSGNIDSGTIKLYGIKDS